MAISDLHLERWTPELRRAVLRVCPDFFAWPADRQTRYRVALPETDRTEIDNYLLEYLLPDDARTPPSPLDDCPLPLPVQNRLNELLLPVVGIGEDAFFLNECLDEGLSILDFPTLRDYDEHDHACQQRARAEEDSSYRPRPYLGGLYACWARVMVGGRLTYLTLSMAAGALYNRIQEASANELDRLIPHRHVAGPHDGEVEGELIRWDRRIEAGGHEALLEELQHRVWSYKLERWETLQAECAARGSRAAYIIDNPFPAEHPEERNMEIVFTCPQALGRIRFEFFMADCRRIERAPTELDDAAATEIALLHRFIATQHEELLQNFDPRLTRLRKRKRIMMHQRAFDALSPADDEDN